ncbi:MAG: BamA/TamA family outer membrane protein [Vicinamibacterales bacterium]
MSASYLKRHSGRGAPRTLAAVVRFCPHAWTWLLLGVMVGVLGAPAASSAQYFGRNKVQYRTFTFQILKTDHFDIYYYPEEAEAAGLVSRMAERWHARLSRFFSHDLRGRQVIILYAVSAHFRQTNAVEGLIGEGTGGVTEGLKRRIVLPVSGSLSDTDHVLGHELVHAFQFDLTGEDPRENTGAVPGILAFPLWFVEGMAEYLSLGPVDAQTAMWLRDAALREKLPRIRDLDNPKYFPYRWGHAFWAYLGAKYGDRMVASLVRSAANPRFDLEGLAHQLGTTPDTLTAEWHAAIMASAQRVTDEALAVASTPRLLLGPKNGGGRYNVGPKVSPDGRHVAFFSERDRFSVALYLADADTGRIERKLLESATDPHFDSLQFLSSAGAWSPDGRRLAVAAIRAGRPVIALVDVRSGRIAREVKLPGLDDVLNPTFAPDGRSLVISGNAGGLIDLYRVSLSSPGLERLTRDPYADLDPVFTPDGRSVVFVTERFSTDLTTLASGPLRLARIDLASQRVTPIAAFLAGKQISPQVSADGREVTFVADPDGISNLYRIDIDGGPVTRLSSVPTGVAGITSASPTLSAAAAGRLVFSVFEDDGHAIYVLDPAETVGLVPPEASLEAAVLPGRAVPGGDVFSLLSNTGRGLPPTRSLTAGEPYRQKLALDTIGQPTVSGSISDFGARVSGGVSAVFSDMLGDRGLGVQGQIGGTLADFGGQLLYLNRKHRWNWAASLSSVPYAIGYLTRQDTEGQTQIREVVERQTVHGAFATAARPFNVSSRLEVVGGVESLSFSRDTRTRTFERPSGELLDLTRARESLGPPIYLGQTSVAFVHDTSFFGATSPIYGARSRFELGRTAGSLQYTSMLADWRRYFMPVRPLTVAVRALHYGRYGRDSEHDQLLPLYAGYPEFVRGYGVGSFKAGECLEGSSESECDVFRSLLGSRLAVANIEVHAPMPGLLKGELEYGRVPVDVAAFMDAGVSWTNSSRPSFLGGSRQVVRSVGAAVRVNLFGIAVVELSASHPLDRQDRRLQWQLGVRQGF